MNYFQGFGQGWELNMGRPNLADTTPLADPTPYRSNSPTDPIPLLIRSLR